ncbi:MAG: acyltransferase-like protein, partial [Chloroflexi bacterium]|nr:acyltransferase-like protein [Chloroflexota bacterium]
IEVQFYLAFPLAVWLVDRFAWRGVLLIAVVTFGYRVAGASGLLAYQPVDLPDVFLSRWLGFALGMLVAVRIRHSTEQGLGFRRELTVLLGAVSLFLAASYFLYGPMAHWAYQPKDLLFAGVYSALLYLACTVGSRAGQLFARRVPVWIGKISYSLYLVHLPIIFALAPTVLALKLHPATTFAVMLVVGIPVVLTVAALFFHVFERPFLNAPVVREQRSSQRSALSQPLAMPVEHQVRDGERSQNRVTGTAS